MKTNHVLQSANCRPSVARSVLFVLGVALGAVLGCGSSDADSSDPQETPDPTTTPEHALKVYVGPPGAQRLVLVRPTDEDAYTMGSIESDAPSSSPSEATDKPGPSPLSVNQGRSVPGRRLQATTSQGGVSYDTNMLDAQGQQAPGTQLLVWATQSCGHPGSISVTAPPWQIGTYFGDLWYIFQADSPFDHTSSWVPFASCDTVLAAQEVLLCAADKLTELGDSPGTVTWESTDYQGNPMPITIPPQAAADRFIARDMALNALGHFGRLTAQGYGGLTCAERYAAMAASGVRDIHAVPEPAWVPAYFAPKEISLTSTSPSSDVRAVGAGRLKYLTSLVASAGRLVRDLIERSVREDISGAQQQLAQTGDALRAARRAWGVAVHQSPYNTLRHAIRVLFGRLEIGFAGNANPPDLLWEPHGPTRDDPRCSRPSNWQSIQTGGGHLALDLLQNLADGVSARWDDIPPKSPRETLALSILDRAGIIAPAREDVATDMIKPAVEAQLVREAAIRAGQSYDDFKSTDQAKAVKAVIDTLSAEELRFALDRVYDAFRLLTDTPPPGNNTAQEISNLLSKQATQAGLSIRALTGTPEIASLGGIVISGGIPRDDLAADVMARMRSAQITSQCDMAVTPGFDPLGPEAADVTSLQSAFHLGAALQRTLARIASKAGSSDPAGVRAFAELASSELREWAGPGVIVNSYASYVNGSWEEYAFTLVGITPQDLGADSFDELSRRLVAVPAQPLDTNYKRYPTNPAIAECVAGIRKSCPPDLVNGSIRRPSTPLASVDAGPRVGTVLQIWFDVYYDVWPEDLFLVLTPENGKPGRVLGAFRGPRPDEYFTEVVSPLQRQLANDVMGIHQSEQTERTCTNISLLSYPHEYCIAGMKRDQFVPLANELTSSGTGSEDSWRHYLDVAKSTADKADELGRQLIELGEKRDFRQEAAVEELGDQCGVYPSDSTIATAGPNGVVSPSKNDAELAACTSGPTKDIVFLRDDPFAGMEPADATKEIRKIFCTNSTKLAFCSKPASEQITHDGLNYLTGAILRDNNITQACRPITDAFTPRQQPTDKTPFDLPAFAKLTSTDWSTQTGMLTALMGLHLIEQDDREWVLLINQKPLLGTYKLVKKLMIGDQMLPADREAEILADSWPACTRAKCSDVGQFIGKLFPQPASDGEFYPSLRREIERTVFYMGAMAGRIPAGAVQMPLPVANWTKLAPDTTVPAPALYGASKFQPEVDAQGNSRYALTKEGYLGTAPWGVDEKAIMGAAESVQSAVATGTVNKGLFADRVVGAGKPNNWRDLIYNQATVHTDDKGYLLLPKVVNEGIAFNPSLVEDGPSIAPYPRELLGQWLREAASDYQQKRDLAAKMRGMTYHTEKKVFRYFNPGGDEKVLCTKTRGICETAHVSPVFMIGDPGSKCGSGGSGDETLFVADTAAFNPRIAQLTGPWTGWFSLTELLGEEGADCVDDTIPAARCLASNVKTAGWDYPKVPDVLGGQPPAVYFSRGPSYQRSWVYAEHYSEDTRIPLSHERLRPSECSPRDRVEMFMSRDLADSTHAMETLVRALGVSCIAGNQDTATNPKLTPPKLDTVDDLQYLEAWVGVLGNVTKAAASAIFLVDVPEEVVDIAKNHGINVGAVGQGRRGEKLLALEKELRSIENGFANLGSSFALLAGEIRKARLQIVGAGLANDARQLDIALKRLENDRQLAIQAGVESSVKFRQLMSYGGIAANTASQVIQALGQRMAKQGKENKTEEAVVQGATAAAAAGAATGGTGAIVVAGLYLAKGLFDAIGVSKDAEEALRQNQINIDYGLRIGGVLDQSVKNSNDTKENDISTILVGMSNQTVGIYQAINDQLTGIQNGTSDTLSTLNDLVGIESKARVALAKAAEADFVEEQGKLVPLHVNTVLRRQFDVLRARYERALENAKRSTYIARLAIEERLGTRLADLKGSLGPLEAPSVWVDDLCTVQGVDYNKLRSASGDTGGVGADAGQAEIDLIKGFADQYIGDYVAKLGEVVDFYNIKYPFQQGDDTAVLSVREDLRGGGARCLAETRNLLFHSDHLETPPLEKGEDGRSHQGWLVSGCSETACLQVGDGLLMTNPANTDAGTAAPVVPPGGIGGVTWLKTVARSGEQLVSSDVKIPAGIVYQSVELRGGLRHVLSWWDMARTSDGKPLTAQAAGVPIPDGGPALVPTLPYRVSVFDNDWNPVATDSYGPSLPGALGANWSERQSLELLPPADGLYHVAFAAAGADVVGASLAIANVQLEVGTANAVRASGYQSTSASRMAVTGDCPVDDPEAFRRRFEYRCQDGECFYELKDGFILDTELLNRGATALVGKVAAGNYNYRNNGVALNVVGSGVVDCSKVGSTGCYASGYLEYDLEHDAHNAAVEDYSHTTRCFDFGTGRINHGKALATERYITNPIGSADQSLITQSAIRKSELVGRPLSGRYGFRIKDTPALVWSQVNDIQIVLTYRYWSRIDRSEGN
jgi:hypothetical protein